MSHMCKRIFKFKLQWSSYWQNIKFSRYCPKFHIFTKIVIFQVYLQLFRPIASSLWILWQGHVRNTLFHCCQLWAVKLTKPPNPKIDGWDSRKLLMLDRGINMHQYMHRKLIKRWNPNSLLRLFNLSELEWTSQNFKNGWLIMTHRVNCPLKTRC